MDGRGARAHDAVRMRIVYMATGKSGTKLEIITFYIINWTIARRPSIMYLR